MYVQVFFCENPIKSRPTYIQYGKIMMFQILPPQTSYYIFYFRTDGGMVSKWGLKALGLGSQLGELFFSGGGEGKEGRGKKYSFLCFPWLPPSFQASRAGFFGLASSRPCLSEGRVGDSFLVLNLSEL